MGVFSSPSGVKIPSSTKDVDVAVSKVRVAVFVSDRLCRQTVPIWQGCAVRVVS